MAYQIILKPSAQKELEKLRNKDKEKIYRAINNISLHPYNAKKLSGEYSVFYVIRAWPYRIVFFIHEKDKIIIITKISHRQGFYL